MNKYIKAMIQIKKIELLSSPDLWTPDMILYYNTVLQNDSFNYSLFFSWFWDFEIVSL